jgi:hypothetical protein
LLGEAVDGPLKGTRLEFLPSWLTTWEEWKARHPDSVALSKDIRDVFDPYTRYYASDDAGVIGETFRDDRLYVKEFVIGVALNEEAAAYPFSQLNREPVVNDDVGGVPVVVTFNPASGSGVVFERRVTGEEGGSEVDVLTFVHVEDLVMEDEQTGSRWDMESGLAIDGALSGAVLTRVKSTRSFWFGWKDFYPETRIYGIAEE